MIDEKKLIEQLKGYKSKWKLAEPFHEGIANGLQVAIEATEKQPKVGEWIPCSERLPKDSGDYFVWYDNGDDEEGCMVMNFDAGIGDFGYWCDEYDRDTLGFLDSEFIYFDSAVAWMPLPESYKE